MSNGKWRMELRFPGSFINLCLMRRVFAPNEDGFDWALFDPTAIPSIDNWNDFDGGPSDELLRTAEQETERGNMLFCGHLGLLGPGPTVAFYHDELPPREYRDRWETVIENGRIHAPSGTLIFRSLDGPVQKSEADENEISLSAGSYRLDAHVIPWKPGEFTHRIDRDWGFLKSEEYRRLSDEAGCGCATGVAAACITAVLWVEFEEIRWLVAAVGVTLVGYLYRRELRRERNPRLQSLEKERRELFMQNPSVHIVLTSDGTMKTPETPPRLLLDFGEIDSLDAVYSHSVAWKYPIKSDHSGGAGIKSWPDVMLRTVDGLLVGFVGSMLAVIAGLLAMLFENGFYYGVGPIGWYGKIVGGLALLLFIGSPIFFAFRYGRREIRRQRDIPE